MFSPKTEQKVLLCPNTDQNRSLGVYAHLMIYQAFSKKNPKLTLVRAVTKN